MRRLLAVDTSTWLAAVALVEGVAGSAACRVVASCVRRVEDSHAARLLPMVDSLLAESGWSRSSLDAYAAVRGPGSFTGIRVGLGVLRGLGLASGRPCLGIGSLEAMAEKFGTAPGPRVPLMDAARGGVFGAVYDASSSPPREIEGPWLSSPEGAARRAGAGAVAFGAGAERYSQVLAAAGLSVAPGQGDGAAAEAAGRIAWLRLDTGARDDDGMSPLYLRPADAELAG